MRCSSLLGQQPQKSWASGDGRERGMPFAVGVLSCNQATKEPPEKTNQSAPLGALKDGAMIAND
jgi:hypothetical protein